jgi:hypothetical protein
LRIIGYIAVDWFDGPTEGALQTDTGCFWFEMLDDRIHSDSLDRRLFTLRSLSADAYASLLDAVRFLGHQGPWARLIWQPDESADWQHLQRTISRLEADSTTVSLLMMTRDFDQVFSAWTVTGELTPADWSTLLD